MPTLTIRQLDEHTHARLGSRAAQHGRSVAAEVRAILDAEVPSWVKRFSALNRVLSDHRWWQISGCLFVSC